MRASSISHLLRTHVTAPRLPYNTLSYATPLISILSMKAPIRKTYKRSRIPQYTTIVITSVYPKFEPKAPQPKGLRQRQRTRIDPNHLIKSPS